MSDGAFALLDDMAICHIFAAVAEPRGRRARASFRDLVHLANTCKRLRRIAQCDYTCAHVWALFDTSRLLLPDGGPPHEPPFDGFMGNTAFCSARKIDARALDQLGLYVSIWRCVQFSAPTLVELDVGRMPTQFGSFAALQTMSCGSVCWWLIGCPNLTALTVRNHNPEAPSGRTPCPRLRSLTVDGAGMSAMVRLLDAFPTVEKLKFFVWKRPGELSERLVRAILDMPNLRELRIADANPTEPPNDFIPFRGPVPPTSPLCKTLAVLDLGHIRMQVAGIRSLRGLSALTTLSVQVGRGDDEAMLAALVEFGTEPGVCHLDTFMMCTPLRDSVLSVLNTPRFASLSKLSLRLPNGPCRLDVPEAYATTLTEFACDCGDIDAIEGVACRCAGLRNLVLQLDTFPSVAPAWLARSVMKPTTFSFKWNPAAGIWPPDFLIVALANNAHTVTLGSNKDMPMSELVLYAERVLKICPRVRSVNFSVV